MASDRQEQGNDSLKLEELRMFCSPLELLLILNHWLVKPMSLKIMAEVISRTAKAEISQ